jgi:hypothetical protein
MPNGWGGVIKAMGLTFIAFQGFEVISQCSEEVKNPKQTRRLRTSTPSMPTSEPQSKSRFCRRQRPDDKVQIRYKALGGLVFATLFRGDGGSRTRVRREDHSNHYMRILSFELHSTVSDRQATDGTTPSRSACGEFRRTSPGALSGYPV